LEAALNIIVEINLHPFEHIFNYNGWRVKLFMFCSPGFRAKPFYHISNSKAPLRTAAIIREKVQCRLQKAVFKIFEMPFGRQSERELHISRESPGI